MGADVTEPRTAAALDEVRIAVEFDASGIPADATLTGTEFTLTLRSWDEPDPGPEWVAGANLTSLDVLG